MQLFQQTLASKKGFIMRDGCVHACVSYCGTSVTRPFAISRDVAPGGKRLQRFPILKVPKDGFVTVALILAVTNAHQRNTLAARPPEGSRRAPGKKNAIYQVCANICLKTK